MQEKELEEKMESRKVTSSLYFTSDPKHVNYDQLEQLFCPINGVFEVELDDGLSKVAHRLTDATSALYVPQGLWRTIRVERQSSVLLVLASLHFDEADYIRDYQEFCAYAQQRRTEEAGARAPRDI